MATLGRSDSGRRRQLAAQLRRWQMWKNRRGRDPRGSNDTTRSQNEERANERAMLGPSPQENFSSNSGMSRHSLASAVARAAPVNPANFPGRNINPMGSFQTWGTTFPPVHGPYNTPDYYRNGDSYHAHPTQTHLPIDRVSQTYTGANAYYHAVPGFFTSSANGRSTYPRDWGMTA